MKVLSPELFRRVLSYLSESLSAQRCAIADVTDCQWSKDFATWYRTLGCLFEEELRLTCADLTQTSLFYRTDNKLFHTRGRVLAELYVRKRTSHLQVSYRHYQECVRRKELKEIQHEQELFNAYGTEDLARLTTIRKALKMEEEKREKIKHARDWLHMHKLERSSSEMQQRAKTD